VVCFFFQAEDGIRDFHVTGVQTCALPISFRSAPSSRVCPNSELILRVTSVSLTSLRAPGIKLFSQDVRSEANPISWMLLNAVMRSEERRVGKECRSGWSVCRSLEKGGVAR